MKEFLKMKVRTIFIILGHSCNMQCAYCMQRPVIHEQLTNKINPKIYDFIEALQKESGDPIHIQFFGGEPLLYFQNLKEIVEETKRRQIPLSYGVITNGRALTDEMVNFFNENEKGMAFTLSWDGYQTKDTRLFDVFADPILKGRLLSLKRLGLSGVISARAYPKEMLAAFQDISNEYRKIHGYQVYVNLDEIFDTGIARRELLDVDYDRIEREMKELALLYLQALTGKESSEEEYVKINYLEGFFRQIRHFYIDKGGKWERTTVCCGNGLTTLNMDVEGNLYPCHNTDEKAGSITGDFFPYLYRILRGDNIKERRAECLDCPALAYCQGGCKIVDEKTRRETYCRLKRAVFVPVISVFEAYGRRLEGADKNG